MSITAKVKIDKATAAFQWVDEKLKITFRQKKSGAYCIEVIRPGGGFVSEVDADDMADFSAWAANASNAMIQQKKYPQLQSVEELMNHAIGVQFAYHRGLLKERDITADSMARRLASLAEAGKVGLAQRKNGVDDFTYLVWRKI